MLECTVSEFVEKSSVSDGVSLLERIGEVRNTEGTRAAIDVFLRDMGIKTWKFGDGACYEDEYNYYQGLLLAYLGRAEAAAERIEQSHTTPGVGGDLIYDLHQCVSRDIAAHRDLARSRGLPSLLVASMPRASSASLGQNLASFFGMTGLRVSAGAFPNYVIIPSWFRFFRDGGATTHDHFGPSAFNLKVLEAEWKKPIFVLVRDPRAATSSVLGLEKQVFGRIKAPTFDERLIDVCVNQFIPWLQAWLDYDRSPGRKLKIHWITYRDATCNLRSVLKRFCDVFSAYPALAACMANASYQQVKANFVQGDDEAWRDRVKPETRERLWEALSPEMIALLDLKR